MRNKKNEVATDEYFRTHQLPTYQFRIRDVLRILAGIKRWRLEKFLGGEKYKLSPSDHIGMGRGAWRIFKHEDLYRLAIAYRLTLDGFTPTVVSNVLQEIRDQDLLDIDEHGESTASCLGLFRNETEAEPRVEILASRKDEQPYYVLKVDQIIRAVNKSILALKKEEESKR